MIRLAMIRHGPTQWNTEGRIQGRSDIPLSQVGREQISRRRLPAEFQHFEPVCSPLRRAMDTAYLLGMPTAKPEPALIEMHWGDWEGALGRHLRQNLGPELSRNEARGLDFKPPGGETPRQVQQRLHPWFSTVARRGRPVLAVTHKGVIRATLALATGWDMVSKPPIALDWGSIHVFILDQNAMPYPERFNIPMLRSGNV